MQKTVFTSLKRPIQIVTATFSPSGGEGSIHKIVNHPVYTNHCVKIFKETNRKAKEEKVKYMIANKSHSLDKPHHVFCWPVEALFNDKDAFIGFVMPLAASPSIQLYEFVNMSIAENLRPQWNKFDKNTREGFQNRLKLCVNLASAVHSLHSIGQYVFVDFKPQNILVTLEGKISITDIDSFQVTSNSGRTFAGDVITQEYAPADHNAGKTVHWDRFSIAIVFYQLLLGIHPYAASCPDLLNAPTIADKIKHGLFTNGSNKTLLSVIPPPHAKFHSLLYSIRSLFMRAFESASSSQRPSAEEWGKVLFVEVQNGFALVS